jgi:hypothetical protein
MFTIACLGTSHNYLPLLASHIFIQRLNKVIHAIILSLFIITSLPNKADHSGSIKHIASNVRISVKSATCSV